MIVNITNKSFKKCAFCKFWYDPTNLAISPKSPKVGLWEYNRDISNICLKKNMKFKAINFCDKYECKI